MKPVVYVNYKGQRMNIDDIHCPAGYRIVLSGKYPDNLYVSEIRKDIENTVFFSKDIVKAED